MGFKTGVVIGGLATAVVALGVAVVLLASDSGDSGRAVSVTSDQNGRVVGPPCKLESMGGEMEIELSSEAIGCAEARGVYAQYRKLVRSGDAAGIGRASEVAGWRCEEFPYAEYPLIVRCRRGADKFAVVGLAPDAHTNQAPAPKTAKPEEPVFFQTPSRNIACAMTKKSVRCDIDKRDWSPPPKPEDCTLDWGHAIELERSGSTFLCAGDTVEGPAGFLPVLKYGEAAADGDFVCESQRKRLVCANLHSKHGIWLSIQMVKLF